MAWLNEAQIRPSLPPEIERRLGAIDVFAEIDSTSNFLLAQPAPAAGGWRVAIAQRQKAGRGRGDRRWYSPAGGGLWMSAAYTFAKVPDNLSALTLAIGAGVAGVLRRLGVADIALKWPNDLLVDGRKLGGILLDSSAAGATIVSGLGINTDLSGASAETIVDPDDDRPALVPVDLKAVLEDPPPMPELAATMIECLVLTLRRYELEGFAAFAADWSELDWLNGRRVVVRQRQQTCAGVAAGVAATGALVVQDGDDTHHVVSGTVRLSDEEGAHA